MEKNKVEKIPEEVMSLINHYRNISIGENKGVHCPYFRNVKRVRAELRSLVGKGSPSEIEEEVLIYAKLRGFDLENSSENDIREFMQTQGIGIDCSGFVSHILDSWLGVKDEGRLWTNIKLRKTSFYRSLIRLLRPIENIDADLLTSDLNSRKIDLKNIHPGDLLRLKGLNRGHHVAIIIEVYRNLEGELKSFKYAESSENYGIDNGVRIGEVEVKDQNGELRNQKWLSVDKEGISWTLRQLEKGYDDNGLRRPLFFVK